MTRTDIFLDAFRFCVQMELGYRTPSLLLFCSVPWQPQHSWMGASIPPPSHPFAGGALQLLIS